VRWHRSWVTNRRQSRRDVLFHIPTASALVRRVRPASSGGAENQVLILARELARRGFHVGIATLDDDYGLRAQIDGVDVIAQAASPTDAPVIRTVIFWMRLASTLITNPSTVIVQRCANIHTAPVALLARVLRRRFVFASSGVRDFDRAAWNRLHWWLFRFGVRLAGVVVVQTEEQVRLCHEHFGRRSVLIKSVAEPAQTPASDPDSFLWVGRLSSHKQPLAYLELVRALPDARFRMVAVEPAPNEDGVDVAELTRIAATLPNLELCPPRQRHELVPLYESAVAVVSTSVSEGMPNVFLEGWSRGVPALALTHDPDGVIERQRLGAFADGSPERLAELARRLWERRNDRDELASRCRRYVVREHALEQVADGWVEALGLV
jgi:glycosyltransferase involved in cell wall biosynthesis